MDYALNQFTMHNTQLFVVQGPHSLFTYQNIGTNTATIQGSNDASTWSDIASLASGASLVKEHSYKYLRCLGDTQVSVNRGEGDNIIGGGSSGGTASYPSFTGNADKVLTVTPTEDGVEWTTVSSGGGGGSGGGINVIEYNPSLHEITESTITDANFVPVDGTCTYNNTTKEIELATPAMLNNVVRLDSSTYNAEYVGIKLNGAFNTGDLTIDATNCTSYFGMVMLPSTMSLPEFLTNYQGYSYTETPANNPVNPSELFGLVGDSWGYRTPSPLAFNGDYTFGIVSNSTSLTAMTLSATYMLTAYMTMMPSATVEQIVGMLEASGYDPTQSFIINLQKGVSLQHSKDYDTYFFMLANGDSGTTAALAPTDKLKITQTLSKKINTVPVGAADGDFLHIGSNTFAQSLLGKTITPNTFAQLYDNTSKMIVHANQG